MLYLKINTIIIFIVVFLQACAIQKKTVVETSSIRKVIIEKYVIRNDSVFFIKRNGKMSCISLMDTTKHTFVIQEFSKGKLTGKKFIYESNGNLAYYGEYKKGMKDGWHFSFINGKVWSVYKFKNDKEVYSGVNVPLPNF